MKRVLFMTVMAAIILFVGCEEFTTSYERVDDREFRLLDFIYEPVDVAPGDSVTLIAVFAGRSIDNIDDFIDWKISFNVNINLFGETTVLDEISLESVARRVNRNFSDNTQTVAWRIKIPDDIVRTSSSIPNNWVEMVPSAMRGIVPSEFASMTKDDVIDWIERYVGNDYLPVGSHHVQRTILQFFTVPIRISARLNDPNNKFEHGHTIVSTHTVRYNRHFTPNNRRPGFAAINNNPIIDEVEVFRVRGDVLYAEWWEADRTFRLGINANTNGSITSSSRSNEIVIEDGYSYFLSAYSDGYDFDGYWTLDGNFRPENQTILRKFQLSGENFHEVNHTNFMSINNWTGRITPPTDRRITDFIFWVIVEDETQNERLRPQGSALAEVSGKFVYR